jgi:AcrR family transcriptional regulator
MVEAHEGRRGREATYEMIMQAAEELFSEHGFAGVTVRAIGERAGVSHALVHRYAGTKTEIYRAVLQRQETAILQSATDERDLLTSASLMFRSALVENRPYVRLLTQSALRGLSHEQTPGRFAATERLIELAEAAVAAATPGERAEKDLDPRLVIAGLVALLMGWAAAEDWLRPATGTTGLDEAEVVDGLVRLVRGVLAGNIAGLGGPGETHG